MTPEQIAKLPIGTEVMIRVTLAANEPDSDGDICFGDEDTGGYCRLEQIVGIVPPKPLSVGDRVDYSSSVEASWSTRGRIVAISVGGADAAVQWEAPRNGLTVHNLSALRRVPA